MSASGSPPEEEIYESQDYVFPEGLIMPNTVFVGGIDVRVHENDIKDFFSKFGIVKDVKIIADRSGVSKGYGFVSFYEDVDVHKIVRSQISFHGKRLKLGPAIRKRNGYHISQARPVISNPVLQYPNMWNASVSDPYVHHPQVFSPANPYLQTYPYSSSAPVMYHVPLGCQQPGYYPLQQYWPNGDQRSFVVPQTCPSWTCINDTEMSANDTYLTEPRITELNGSPVSTNPQKKVDRCIQTMLTCLMSGDGTFQRSFVPPEDYLKDRRAPQYRRNRPFMKPAFDKAGV